LKKNKLFLILPILLLLTLIITFLTVNVKGANTLEFTFENEIFYDETNPISDFGFNTRNQSFYTDIHNATYSFTEQIDGDIGLEINFIDIYTPSVSCLAVIQSILENHDKVLKIWDNNEAGTISIQNNIQDKTYGSIEFFMRTDDISKVSNILIKYAESILFGFGIDANQFKKFDNTGWSNLGLVPLVNTWYHVKFDFECTTGSYSNLAQYYWKVFVNGKEFGDYTFDNDNAYTDNLFIYSSIGHYAYSTYYDAIGYSWDSDYNVNDNIIPYNYKTNTIEIDNWGFFNNEDGSTTQDYQSTIPYWTRLMTYSRIFKGYGETDNTTVKVPITSSTPYGIYKDFQYSSNDIIEINIITGLDISFESVEFMNSFQIKSFDDTVIINIMFDWYSETQFKVFQYNGFSYNFLQYLDNTFVFHSFNFTIINNLVVLTIQSNTYIFPTIALNKHGLGEIRIDVDVNIGGVLSHLYIDSVGVYINGISQSNDFANYLYKTNRDFNNKNNNLLYFNATGFFGLSMTSTEGLKRSFIYFDYQNVSEINFLNVYEYEEKNVENAYLTITTNSSYQIYSVSIKGIAMIQGTNIYYPTFSSNNINKSESYFSVDSNNRLQFKLIVNDSYLEYIRADFDVQNVATENRSIRFRSDINGNSKGYFIVDYGTATDSFIQFPYTARITDVILPQTKRIESFAILITDEDLDDEDVCTGYVSEIKLIYYPDLEISILTLNLLAIIIPLIIILAPSLAMHKKFGSTGVIITFLLMSLICTITFLIPLWVFVVIVFSSIGFLYAKKRQIGGL